MNRHAAIWTVLAAATALCAAHVAGRIDDTNTAARAREERARAVRVQEAREAALERARAIRDGRLLAPAVSAEDRRWAAWSARQRRAR